jgi:hypothetical protein
MHLYLLNSKDEVLNACKVFKAEVQKQCEKQIMVDTLRVDKQSVHLRCFFKSMVLLPNTLCMVLLTRMLWQKEHTEH